MREELLTLPTTTTGKDTMNEEKPEFTIIMGFGLKRTMSIKTDSALNSVITTDSTLNMVGIHNGFVKLLAEVVQYLVKFHCALHQQTPCAKASVK